MAGPSSLQLGTRYSTSEKYGGRLFQCLISKRRYQLGQQARKYRRPDYLTVPFNFEQSSGTATVRWIAYIEWHNLCSNFLHGKGMDSGEAP